MNEIINETILSGISTVGFPIVAFIMMYNLSTKSIKKLSEMVGELKECVLELKGAISK